MAKLHARIYGVDGTVTDVDPVTCSDEDTGELSPSLNWLYEHIGCDMVQVISVGDGRDLWMDEEGKLNRPFPKNRIATDTFQKYLFPGDFIVGRAVLTWVEE